MTGRHGSHGDSIVKARRERSLPGDLRLCISPQHTLELYTVQYTFSNWTVSVFITCLLAIIISEALVRSELRAAPA